jgi:dephospho-CoA kinase
MLRVGLTGGIGSGKSTVAQRFRELGAVVIDADRLAREVVARDSAGLAAIRRRFGDPVLAPDGSLDRVALGTVVFADPQARKDLEAITHPLIGARTRALMEAAEPEKIVVHDVPLLVELDMAAGYHLTVVVGADNYIRIARLTGGRGLTEAEAEVRIAAQASDRARRATADAWLDNNGTVDGLLAQVDELWQDRIVGFNDNLMSGSACSMPDALALVAYDDSWPTAAARLVGRITMALGDRAVAVEHIGSTSIPGLTAVDVLDFQVGVRVLADADGPGFVQALAGKGFPRDEGVDRESRPVPGWAGHEDEAGARDPWRERAHGNADPGRMVRLHVRQTDDPAWRNALLLRDWLRAQAGEREAYGRLKSQLAQTSTTSAEYVAAKGVWWEKASAQAEAWARHTGWSGT